MIKTESVVSFCKKLFWRIALIVIILICIQTLAIFAFPVAMSSAKWLFGDVYQTGLNIYLARAITTFLTLVVTLLLMKFIFGWDTILKALLIDPKKKYLGFIGIALVVVVYFLGMWWLTKDQQFAPDGTPFRGAHKDPITGVLSESPNLSGITVEGSDIEPLTKKNATALVFQKHIKENFHSHLNEFGEFSREFISDPENINRIPWVDQTTGDSMIFYCLNSDGNLHLFAWEGRCADGKTRERADKGIQTMLLRDTHQRKDEQKKIEEQRQSMVDFKTTLDVVEKKQAELEKQVANSSVKEVAGLRTEVKALREAWSRRVKEMEREINGLKQARRHQVEDLEKKIRGLAAYELDHEARLLYDLTSWKKDISSQINGLNQPTVQQGAVNVAFASSPEPIRARVIPEKRRIQGWGAAYNSWILREFNGVDVVFDQLTLTIWKRERRDEPIEAVKQRTPTIFSKPNLYLQVPAKGEIVIFNEQPPRTDLLNLRDYRDWTRGLVWVEITLSGTDANGNSQQVLLM